MIRPQPVLFGMRRARAEVNEMVSGPLLLSGLVIRTVLGAAVVVALVWFLFKLSKLAEAYTKKLETKR